MKYQPIVTATNGPLKVTALVGTGTAFLGFDLEGGPELLDGLLGFAVRRTNLKDGGEEWLKNPLKFERAPAPGQFNIAGTPTNLAPIQQFHWGDHRLEAGAAYRYEVSALYGELGDPRPRFAPAAIEIAAATHESPAHGHPLSLYFNRGVVATPAYRQQFDNRRPGAKGAEDVAEAQAYLSRGLWEALLAFVGGARSGDELWVAIYELHHASVGDALQAAIDRGVKLRLLYHAKTGEEDERSPKLTRAMAQRLRPAADAALPAPEIRPRRNVQNISHNKVVVHLRDGAPLAVWTGSTNFTDAGFFLQTNVGVVLRDPAIARAYAAYFDLLFADPLAAPLEQAIAAQELTFGGPIPRVFFSPVAGDELLRVAAGLIAEAQEVVLISCPFGLERDGAIERAIKALDARVLVLGLMNTNQRGDLVTLDVDSHDTQEFAVPDWIKRLNGEQYDASAGAGNQIHVKSLVVDPWGPRPRVLIGSANFSGESVNDNDENMLLIDGDPWAAAVVATEFLRAFEHYKFRNSIREIANQVDTQPRPHERAIGGWAGGVLGADGEPVESLDEWFLDPEGLEAGAKQDGSAVLGAIEAAEYWLDETGAWVSPYFQEGSPRWRERRAFAP